MVIWRQRRGFCVSKRYASAKLKINQLREDRQPKLVIYHPRNIDSQACIASKSELSSWLETELSLWQETVQDESSVATSVDEFLWQIDELHSPGGTIVGQNKLDLMFQVGEIEL